jgi:hypothetical protein
VPSAGVVRRGERRFRTRALTTAPHRGRPTILPCDRSTSPPTCVERRTGAAPGERAATARRRREALHGPATHDYREALRHRCHGDDGDGRATKRHGPRGMVTRHKRKLSRARQL